MWRIATFGHKSERAASSYENERAASSHNCNSDLDRIPIPRYLDI